MHHHPINLKRYIQDNGLKISWQGAEICDKEFNFISVFVCLVADCFWFLFLF